MPPQCRIVKGTMALSKVLSYKGVSQICLIWVLSLLIVFSASITIAAINNNWLNYKLFFMNWEIFIELFRPTLRRTFMQNRHDALTIRVSTYSRMEEFAWTFGLSFIIRSCFFTRSFIIFTRIVYHAYRFLHAYRLSFVHASSAYRGTNLAKIAWDVLYTIANCTVPSSNRVVTYISASYRTSLTECLYLPRACLIKALRRLRINHSLCFAMKNLGILLRHLSLR